MVSTFLYGDHVRANGIRQHYLRFGGAGRKLVVVPGITSPAVTFAEFCEPLGEMFDVYALDARGRGLSSSGDGLDYGIESLGRDLSNAIDALGLGPVGLIGHSMGARTIPAAVDRHGAPCIGMMLLDPPVTGPGRRGHDNSDDWFIEQIERGRVGDMTIDEMRVYFPRWTDAQLRLRCEWIHTCDPRAIVQFRREVLSDDFHGTIARLSVPVCLVVGGRSSMIRPEEESEIKSLNTVVETVRLPEAGHMIPWDEPGHFVALARRFFG